jgi:endonuclease/exonuclease/phosphatase family metal-dependent hydrolase
MLLPALALAVFLARPASAHDKDRGDGDRDGRKGDDAVVRIMTHNVYEGTDYAALSAATNVDAFLAAVSATFQGIAATKPAERAAAIAKEIARHKPDLVGLQEVSIVRTGTTPPATTVVSDLLELIVGELGNLHQRYKVVAVVTGLDAEALSTLGFNVRLTGQDAILARIDSDLKLSNAQVSYFATNLVFPSPVGPVLFKRGWASVDARIDGRAFRFATTHLDALVQPIRQAQGSELIQGIGSDLPVVVVGDFNAVPFSSSDPTYQNFRDADFDDAWLLRRGFDPGYTCCQASDLLNPQPTLTQRIDWVLLRGRYRGDFHVLDAELLGEKRRDLTPSGLWPSDHAGLFVKLRLPERRQH